ncbi:MAG TPA: hypothetical protein H9697_06890 [Candidatus Mediterraneibacter faecavium]|uniref:Uncharacterized protein n=1 Tax=Candidatus Mediterraneibacter faecavium TaxID=2838668 RepID=A0A9D2QAX3_9FIRM|nr:hypothetical protein [Candidatus Mediterraneibacter faecavium]
MKTFAKKIFRWTVVLGSVVLIAGITSLITTKKTVWITVKRKSTFSVNNENEGSNTVNERDAI